MVGVNYRLGPLPPGFDSKICLRKDFDSNRDMELIWFESDRLGSLPIVKRKVPLCDLAEKTWLISGLATSGICKYKIAWLLRTK